MKILIKFLLKRRRVTKSLVEQIKDSDKDGVLEIIKTHHPGYINIHYKDEEGNSLLHIAAIYAEKNHYLVKHFYPIFKSLKELGVRSDVVNDKNERADQAITDRDLIKCLLIGIPTRQSVNLSQIEGRYGSGANFYSDHSRVYPGVRLTDNLNLYYGSKNPQKSCEVPDKFAEFDKKDGRDFSLHDRLAVAASYHGKHDDSSNNYVTINIGFIVSQQAYDASCKEERRRQFITLPFRDAKYGVIWTEGEKEAVHTEELLYQYLSKPEVIKFIIQSLEKTYQITPGFKIYALILDLHTRNNMCDKCTAKTFENQIGSSFIQKLERQLDKSGYILPSEKNPCPDLFTPQKKRLHIVTRVSHAKKFDEDERSPFSLRHFKSIPVFKREEEVKEERNIKKFGNAVILKDTRRERYSGFWSIKSQCDSEQPKRKAVFANQTAFINYYEKAAFSRLQCSVEHQSNKSEFTREL